MSDAKARMRDWSGMHFETPDRLPFSFKYEGKDIGEAIAGWQFSKTAGVPVEGKTPLTLVLTSPDGLQVRCEALIYADFAAVEWTLHFENHGKTDSGIISDIKDLDADPSIPGEGGDYILNRNVGAKVQNSDFQPIRETLRKNSTRSLAAFGGKPSNHDMPYFNIQKGNAGAIVTIGWPGQWAADFRRDGEDGLVIFCGLELTHFRLHPGENARTSLMAVLFWDGDRDSSQNMFRRWMIDHNVPRAEDGQPFKPQIFACSSHQFGEMVYANEDNQKQFVDAYIDRGIPLDYWWMDAGWYINDEKWPRTGTWEVDRKRFPNGLRGVTDRIHERGLKSIVWFEPERVAAMTWLYNERQQWLLGTKPKDRTKLLNLGDREVYDWVLERFDGLLVSEGIDMYRQDFNVDPLPFWRANDDEDRQGITEIKYLTGYLSYWDELRRRHPGMVIDNCAGGGKRLDLESVRRSVPLLRSDYIFEPEGQQGHHMGLAQWLPYHGTGMSYTVTFTEDERKDRYVFRSCMSPDIICCYDMRRDDLNIEALRRMHEELRRVSEFYYCDFWPLTDNNVMPESWMAWQYDDPKAGRGVVQAFRREKSPYISARFSLRGLEAEALYRLEFSNDEEHESSEMRGEALMNGGLELVFRHAPDSAVIFYEKVR